MRDAGNSWNEIAKVNITYYRARIILNFSFRRSLHEPREASKSIGIRCVHMHMLGNNET